MLENTGQKTSYKCRQHRN